MLIFNCTKAAADFFTSIRQGKKISPMSPAPQITLANEPGLHDHQHWHWMIHVTKFAQKNILLAIDSDTRFCMFFFGIRKGNVQNFLQQFNDRLVLHLGTVIKMGGQCETMFETSLQMFMEHHQKYTFVQRGDRSVQMHINDAFMRLKYDQDYWEDYVPTEEELFISDIRYNDTLRKPRQYKDFIYPTQELLRIWLSHYANLDEQTITRTIKQYQQTNNNLWKHSFNMGINDLNFDKDEPEYVKGFFNDIVLLKDYVYKKS